ncbi:MAG TPA: hypothetical protein VFF68_11905 [Anaerolineaceae bacterium]|nr:hypothetical protein [Anaerolineaceae bacterium]
MYNSLINPITVFAAFALVLGALNWFKPQAGRIVTGVFFLLMAWGVNVTVLLTDPALIAATGANAILPVYRWFFNEILASYPVPLLIALIAFETTVGVLILSKGRGVRLGVLAAIAFCLWLTPVGVEEFIAPVLALAIGLLLRTSFDRSLVEMITGKVRTKELAVEQG